MKEPPLPSLGTLFLLVTGTPPVGKLGQLWLRITGGCGRLFLRATRKPFLGARLEELSVRSTLSSFDCGSEGLLLISAGGRAEEIWYCSTLDQACHLVKYRYEKPYEMQGRRAKNCFTESSNHVEAALGLSNEPPAKSCARLSSS